mgnify:CR=1 FL=1
MLRVYSASCCLFCCRVLTLRSRHSSTEALSRSSGFESKRWYCFRRKHSHGHAVKWSRHCTAPLNVCILAVTRTSKNFSGHPVTSRDIQGLPGTSKDFQGHPGTSKAFQRLPRTSIRWLLCNAYWRCRHYANVFAL